MSPEAQNPTGSTPFQRLRMLLLNPISLAGSVIALVSLANIAFLFVIDLISTTPSPYIGILAYMVMPAFLILGLGLMLLGLILQRRKKREEGEEIPHFPILNLNDAHQRSLFVFVATFAIVFLGLSAIGSYKAYEFTDSVKFCGQLCHSVMNPEFVAYQQSSHARVACVECHVGSGATWYVKSKMSGARQVFATAFNTYPRPIPTPVHDLRPAQDTCEECHWPKKFYGPQLKTFTHFASDEKNTMRQIRMLINVGGGDPATGAPEGIHWHMNIANEIRYVSSDDKRQAIPYIQVKDMQGRVTEYFAQDSKLSKDQIAKATKRRMDCVDCHNRPSHVYLPPDLAVDNSLRERRLDASLPFIKQQAVAALTGKYATTDAAVQGIAHSIENFYETKYPDLAKSKAMEIRGATEEVQAIYKRTSFPEMHVDWQTHSNNIGHYYYNGCFRCHDGQHVSTDGKTLTKACDTCHTVLSQQEGGVAVAQTEKLSFQHPVDLGDITQVNCSDCHTGGVSP